MALRNWYEREFPALTLPELETEARELMRLELRYTDPSVVDYFRQVRVYCEREIERRKHGKTNKGMEQGGVGRHPENENAGHPHGT